MTDGIIRILIIDDDEEDYILAREAFAQVKHAAYRVEWAPGFNEGQRAIAEDKHDVYFLDYQIGPHSGVELLKAAVDGGCRKPVIMLTGHGGHEVDLEAMRAGAMDYLDKKEVKPATLDRAVRYALAHFRTLEELRKAKDEAEQATLLKDKYVSLVSHDLKGPLGVIYGFLPIVRQQLLESGDRDHANFLDISITATKRMLNMINELLTIGRFKTGKIKLQLRPVDVHKLIEEDLEIFTPFAAQKGVSITNALPPGFTVCADPDLLGEVLHNLLSNAIKFTHGGGTVTVSAPEGKPDTIAVTDTGTGIRPEFQEKLFLYEEKTTNHGTNGEAGTGFGLPLAWDILLAHNGGLYFETTAGTGTTFFVHLPEKGCMGKTNRGK